MLLIKKGKKRLKQSLNKEKLRDRIKNRDRDYFKL